MNIELGERLFQFDTFGHWVAKAQSKFAHAEVPSRHIICVDRKGRICAWGEHFMTARDEDAFPVVAYRMRPFAKPSGETLKLEVK